LGQKILDGISALNPRERMVVESGAEGISADPVFRGIDFLEESLGRAPSDCHIPRRGILEHSQLL
jgi:hypothetical protein